MTAPTLRLDAMQFFGRLASDYHAMFGVTLQALAGQRILDCPSGPCSFVAEAVAA
ncbi:MAG: SAM-dependent methyltransferase, partial [Planctomycetes bacterium]|nr:SAM-dependent methyltransferase [Planctomycetota bacterium]